MIERLQIHINGNEIQAFSRRLEDITFQYLDHIEAIRKSVLVDRIVLDGEIVAYIEGKKRNERIEYLYSFQKLMQRRRKYEIEKYMELCPVDVFFFDIFYLEGKPLLKKSYSMKRTLLEKYVKESGVVNLARRIVTENLEEIEDFFNETLGKRLEGIIIKAMNNTSIYEAEKRSWLWLKWKEEYAEGMMETFDPVIVGKYYGKGEGRVHLEVSFA